MSRRVRLLGIAVAVSAALAVGAEEPPPVSSPPPPDPWGALRLLVGAWEGDAAGEPGTGRVERTFAWVLGDRFLHARNRTVYAPTEKSPEGYVHDDWAFWSHDRGRGVIVLRQLHVEGFVNTYVLEPPAGDGRTLVFSSEAIENVPPGFRARETWRFLADDEVEEVFELAPPGQAFAVYSTARLRRRP